MQTLVPSSAGGGGALGGVISYIDMIGAARFVEEYDRMAEAHGPRFEALPALRHLAARGGRYHAT